MVVFSKPNQMNVPRWWSFHCSCFHCSPMGFYNGCRLNFQLVLVRTSEVRLLYFHCPSLAFAIVAARISNLRNSDYLFSCLTFPIFDPILRLPHSPPTQLPTHPFLPPAPPPTQLPTHSPTLPPTHQLPRPHPPTLPPIELFVFHCVFRVFCVFA